MAKRTVVSVALSAKQVELLDRDRGTFHRASFLREVWLRNRDKGLPRYPGALGCEVAAEAGTAAVASVLPDSGQD